MKSRFKVVAVTLLGLYASNFSLQAQNEVLVNDEDNRALYGAHVIFKELTSHGKKLTVLTNIDGKATVPEEFQSTKHQISVEISYLGYERWTDTLKSIKSLNVSLAPDEVSLNGVVITGQYSANNPEKSLHKIKIIDRSQLDNRGVVNLNEALQFETNLRLSQDNALGASASVQGMSGENVKIMIDGVPMIGRQDGNLDLNQINMNNIERIEIVEGPLSVNYGTNALAGTINLITRKNQSEAYTAGVNSYYESVGQYNLDGRIGIQKGKHRISLSGGRNYFDGWSDDKSFTVLPESKPADSNRVSQWNPKEQFFAEAQYQIKIGKVNTRLFGNVFNEVILDRGSPRAPYNETAFDQTFTTDRYSFGADLSGKASERLAWSILASYNDYIRSKETYYVNLTNLEKTLSGNPDDHDTSRFETVMSRGSLIFGKNGVKFRGELGYDILSEVAYGKRVSEGMAKMADYALFGSIEWSPNAHFTLKPGVRMAYNTNYDAPPVPALNVKYMRGKSSIRASYAMGFRAPSLKELYFDFVDINHDIHGNENLKAETSHNFQVDVTHKMVVGQSITSLEGGIFYNNVKDMITLGQVGNTVTYSYINIGRFRSQGIELGVNHVHNHWRSSAGFVYTGRSNQIDDSVLISGLSYSPEFRLSLVYEFKKIDGNLSLNYKYNGPLPTFTFNDEGELTETQINGYSILDFTGTKFFWNKRIAFTTGVKNILDVKNINTTGGAGGVHSSGGGTIPVAWGRSLFISLKLNLGWN